MDILDIRKNTLQQITGIKFDTSEDLITKDDICIVFRRDDGADVMLCNYSDLDNFITACQKANELWATKL
jgi:hypothetical protein